MEYRRYGKMRMSDYTLSWIVILILLLCSVAGLVFKASVFWVILPILLAVIRFLTIWLPNRETFSIQDGVITARSELRRKVRIIELPQELTLIISLADLCPPFAIRTAVDHQTHILKDKYAVTILKQLPLAQALEHLHRNGMRKHSMRSVQNVFDEHQILYSCVCDQTLLGRLTEGRDCLVILPEALAGAVNADLIGAKVYVERSS